MADITGQLDEISASLAEIAENLSGHDPSAVLAEILELLKAHKSAEQPAAQVTVNVPQQPAPVVNITSAKVWKHVPTYNEDGSTEFVISTCIECQPKPESAP